MANEAIVKVREGKIFKIMDKVDMATPNSFHTRMAVGTKRSMEIYVKIKNKDAGTPVVTLTVNAIRPQAPSTDPVAAADKEALTQTVVQTDVGVKREAFGPDETDPTLPDDVEFVAVMSGAAAQADLEVWVLLKD